MGPRERDRIEEVLGFWFGEPAATPDALMAKMRRWYRGGPAMDAEIVRRFAGLVDEARAGRLEAWRAHPSGWLARILVMDQFTRNALRGSAAQYELDAEARALALEALGDGRARALPLEERSFALMPLVHSEALADQERGVLELEALVGDAPPALRPIFAMGIEQSRKYRAIIARFGRFPHRNALLGRTSTPEEIEFLRDWEAKQPPSTPVTATS